jgi:hydrogenase maturation protein HypF
VSRIPADVAVCPNCLEDIQSPHNRRHQYPFTNCTDCGPRYTIIQGVPYDRRQTTMSGFTMCRDCEQECSPK